MSGPHGSDPGQQWHPPAEGGDRSQEPTQVGQVGSPWQQQQPPTQEGTWQAPAYTPPAEYPSTSSRIPSNSSRATGSPSSRSTVSPASMASRGNMASPVSTASLVSTVSSPVSTANTGNRASTASPASTRSSTPLSRRRSVRWR